MCFFQVHTPILVKLGLCFFPQIIFNKILLYQEDVGHICSTQCIGKTPPELKHNFILIPAFSGIIYVFLK